MTDLDLEAIKARAKGLEAAMDNDTADYDPNIWEMCVDLQRLAVEVERLQGTRLEAKVSEARAEHQHAEALDRLTITDDMIDRAADAIYRELSGKYGDFNYPTDAARAALEAALGGHE